MKISFPTVRARAFLWLQHATPQHLLTAVVRRLSGVRRTFVKNFLIRAFVGHFKVDLEDIARPVPDGFVDFNDFFTRELADGARPIDASVASLVSPVDGLVSAAGSIEDDRLYQAKGINYRLDDLLATDLADARSFRNGKFVTLYLAPWHYHRVHCPIAGHLTALRYVPGSLYSVNDSTVRLLPGLFARNERLIVRLQTAVGAVCVIFVGALNVGSITTPWTGAIRPRKRGMVEDLTPPAEDGPVRIEKGDLLGWFNMGSTVIVLLPPGACRWREPLMHNDSVTLGTRIGTLGGDATD